MDMSDVVVAVIAGAKIVGTESVKQVVKDAYSGLKSVVSKRFKEAEPAIVLIEGDPDNEIYALATQTALVKAGATNDSEIQMYAVKLLEAIRDNLDSSTAQNIGIDLEDVKATTLRISRLQSADDVSVNIRKAEIDGDIEITDITSGAKDYPN